MKAARTGEPAQGRGRPLAELSDTGLLWLINRVVLHPRGFALALRRKADGEVTGWTMEGDGTECWSFGDMPDGQAMDDVGFERVEAFLASLRPTGAQP